MSAPACWMLVTTTDNYARTRAHRFTVQGVKTRHRRKVERMAPGDRICWYLVGVGGFVATATVSSPVFMDTKPIWVSTSSADPYPWRFKIVRDIVRDPKDAVSAADLVDGMRVNKFYKDVTYGVLKEREFMERVLAQIPKSTLDGALLDEFVAAEAGEGE